MGLLERLKLNKTKDFFEWLDLILKNELNSEIKAINFNLYEDTDNKWSVELVGTFSFDKDNDDWACDEVFTTRDHPFVIECESDWKLVETFFIGLVKFIKSFPLVTVFFLKLGQTIVNTQIYLRKRNCFYKY